MSDEETGIWNDPAKFGAFVREEREKRNWSQEKLGQEAGIATNSVFSVEKGRPTVPRTRIRVAVALGVEVE